MAKLSKQNKKMVKRLKPKDFVDNAPPAIVDKARTDANPIKRTEITNWTCVGQEDLIAAV